MQFARAERWIDSTRAEEGWRRYDYSAERTSAAESRCVCAQ